jgi:HK97 family phage prohead protease
MLTRRNARGNNFPKNWRTAMTQFERRSFATHLEVRASSGGNILTGRAASYNTLSADLGGFRETIAPGTFSRAVREKDDCVFTLNHDSNALPLGRVSSGTLQLSEDSAGLNCRCDLPNTQAARDLVESISRWDIREMSFAFQVPDGGDEWGDDTDEEGQRFIKRTLRTVKLFDVSAVLRPAYPTGTSVNAWRPSPMDVSNLLTKVSERALVEARSRGGFAPRPRVAIAEPASRYELHQRAQQLGNQIASEDYNAGLADFINKRPRPNSHIEDK